MSVRDKVSLWNHKCYCLWLVCVVMATTSLLGNESYTALLQKYVHPDGVDYAQWSQNETDKMDLVEYCDELAATRVNELTNARQKAYFINLYNALMIREVLRHYPIDSVKAIAPEFGVFEKKVVEVEGRAYSLDEIEKTVLLQRWDDPRIHFAVNCASASCPPLRAEPYRGPELDQQLKEQAIVFIRSERAIRIDGKNQLVALNPIFEWYAHDFPGEDIRVYLNRFREQKLRLDWDLKYFDYDWSLNASRGN